MTDAARDYYLSGLSNQHAVEKQAIETIERELGRMSDYPALHSRMQQELQRSQTQLERLETLLSKHGTGASTLKETVTAAVGSVSGVVHIAARDEVIKNVLAAIGFKAYEIGSYKALIATAKLAGAGEDETVLKQSMAEEQEMGDWLGENLPSIIEQHLSKQAA
ncbi:DUF892 family protein [Roseomonas elaeocarpi]|uniref:DUF892 family protein n=1 Tax=Roseomonas elaeocarpi TaxID=907779 RepID=A0ABV6JU12_9PROT